MQMEEKAGMKEYLNSLDKAGLESQKKEALLLCHKIAWLDHQMDMVSCELDCVRDQAAKLPAGIGKFHATHSIAAASKEFAQAQENFLQAWELIENGIGSAVMKFQNKDECKPPEKPFPLLAVIGELKSMMAHLETMFRAIDVGIGKTERAEGMECVGNHYMDLVRGGLWESGEGEQALLDVMWPMHTLEKLAGQARDAAHDAAVYVDRMRPKAHSTIKKTPLIQGYFWEKEKQEKQREIKKPQEPPAKEKLAETKKSSLRKRLQEAENARRTAYPTPNYEKEKKVCEMQR